MRRIAVCGCGKLGSVYVALLKAAGFDVYAYDKIKAYTDMLEGCVNPFGSEPSVRELLIHGPGKVHSVALPPSGVDRVIVVNTPSLDNGRFDPAAVWENYDRNVLNIVVSTVSPGTFNHGNMIVYAPTLIALGSIVNDLHRPALRIVGAESEPLRANALAILDTFVDPTMLAFGGPYTPRLTIPEAEFVKIGVNGYCTTKISFANAMAMTCRNVSNCDPTKVLDAIGHDPRVGTSYFRQGGTFGGPCFPRDTKALSYASVHLRRHMQANDMTNEEVLAAVLDSVYREIDHDDKETSIGIIGTAYKSGGAYDDVSFGRRIESMLRKAGHTVYAWDPVLGGDSRALVATLRIAGLPGLATPCQIDVWRH